MFVADDVVWTIILVSSLSNMLVDVFGEVLLEYGVYYTKGYFPNFSIPGFDGFSSTAGGETVFPVLVNGTAPTPEQVELIHTLLASLQAAQ
jgi:hypothetical protein